MAVRIVRVYPELGEGPEPASERWGAPDLPRRYWTKKRTLNREVDLGSQETGFELAHGPPEVPASDQD